MPLIYFFKRSAENDAYQTLFTRQGWSTHFIPVLEFEFAQTAELKRTLSSPDAYSGIIFTSQRAVEAVHQAGLATGDAWASWCARPVYVVGPATAMAARTIGCSPIGEEAGHAEAVAEVIANQHQNITRPLLFLCGSSRRDELPVLLQSREIPLKERHVYHTHPMKNLNLKQLDSPDVAVFFSPSGVNAVHPLWPKTWKETRCIAIGNQTAKSLRNAGLPLTATSIHPTPKSLLKALQSTQQETRNKKPETSK